MPLPLKILPELLLAQTKSIYLTKKTFSAASSIKDGYLMRQSLGHRLVKQIHRFWEKKNAPGVNKQAQILTLHGVHARGYFRGHKTD